VELPAGIYLAVDEISHEISEDILTRDEYEEYSDFKNKKRRAEFLSTRRLMKNLAQETGPGNETLEIRKEPMGKPYGVYGNEHYQLSMAHAGKMSLCGISADHALGVDLEACDRSADERLRNRISHPGEQEQLAKMPLVRLWTIKEAVVKMQGRGLRTNLSEIFVQQFGDHLFEASFDDDKSSIICSFKYQGYWIAIAFNSLNN